MQTASSGILSTPKAVPKAQVAPMQRSNPKEKPAHCPSPAEEEENEYMIPDDECLDDHVKETGEH